MPISRGAVGRAIPRRTDTTREASTEPSVAVTGNVCGSSPAAVSDGPAIIPIFRGDGASIQSARSPMLPGEIEILPFNDRSATSSIRSNTVTGSLPGFSIGMASLLVRDQSHTRPRGLNTSAGCPSAANVTRNPAPSRASITALRVSTAASSLSPAERSAVRQQTAINAPPQIAVSTLRRLETHLLDDFQDLAPPRHPLAPDAIEIGDQRLDFWGADQCLRLTDIGEFVEGIMDSRVGAAPASPAASCLENPDRPRQVIGRVPVIERRPVGRIGHFGAHHEMSCTHRPFLLQISPSLQYRAEAGRAQLYRPSSSLTARSMKSSSSGFWVGLPARWPQIDGIGRSSACRI